MRSPLACPLSPCSGTCAASAGASAAACRSGEDGSRDWEAGIACKSQQAVLRAVGKSLRLACAVQPRHHPSLKRSPHLPPPILQLRARHRAQANLPRRTDVGSGSLYLGQAGMVEGGKAGRQCGLPPPPPACPGRRWAAEAAAFAAALRCLFDSSRAVCGTSGSQSPLCSATDHAARVSPPLRGPARPNRALFGVLMRISMPQRRCGTCLAVSVPCSPHTPATPPDCRPGQRRRLLRHGRSAPPGRALPHRGQVRLGLMGGAGDVQTCGPTPM